MEQGGVSESIVSQAVRQGLPVPNKILNAPEVLPGLEFYYHAFVELSTCRNVGMVEGPIPWIAMDTYAQRLGLEGDDYEYFTTLLQTVDMMYLSYREKNRPKG